jgi:hypothetical protein
MKERTVDWVLEMFGRSANLPRETQDDLAERAGNVAVAVLDRSSPGDVGQDVVLLAADGRRVSLFERSALPTSDGFEIVEITFPSLPPDFQITKRWLVDKQSGHLVGVRTLEFSEPLNGRVDVGSFEQEDADELVGVLEALRRKG